MKRIKGLSHTIVRGQRRVRRVSGSYLPYRSLYLVSVYGCANRDHGKDVRFEMKVANAGRNWLDMLGQAGETLIETLAAIVICTLAVGVITAATLTASTLNKQADDTKTQLQEDQIDAELWKDSTGAALGDSTVKVDGDSYTVTLYGGDTLEGYKLKTLP